MIDVDSVEIFYSIILVLIIALALLAVIKRNNKTLRFRLILAKCTLLIISFLWGWFFPVKIGQIGESSVCKFRYQVFIYDTHDYNGSGDLKDWLFLFNYTNGEKYGAMQFYKKIGGSSEYFGFIGI